MQVFMTGANGFVGLNVVSALVEAGHTVTALVRPNATTTWLEPFGVRIVRGGLDDPAGLAEAIEALFARDLEHVKRAARRRAEQRHRWDNTFEGLTRLYGELVAQRSAVEIVPLRA